MAAASRSGSATALSRLGSLPRVRLERSSDRTTTVVFQTKTIARINDNRQVAEIVLPFARIDEVLRDHRDVERAPLGVAVRLDSDSDVEVAVALIRESLAQELFGWQAAASSP